MLLSHFNNLTEFLGIIIAFVFALTIHEFAHAWVSDRLGDPTARLMGRLTLNPKAHLDPIGTLMILFASFGWAKPVPFDPFNLKNPRRDTMLISLAGPVANLLGASISAILLRLFLLIPTSSSLMLEGIVTFLVTVLMMFVILNVNLAIFNLIPIHPLDGFKIVEGILPERESKQWASLQGLGIFMIILFVFPLFGGTSPVLRFISPIVTSIITFLLP
ncbi:MAG: site-2 protease family protein [Microgenomates group bacterium]